MIYRENVKPTILEYFQTLLSSRRISSVFVIGKPAEKWPLRVINDRAFYLRALGRMGGARSRLLFMAEVTSIFLTGDMLPHLPQLILPPPSVLPTK